MDVGEKPRKFRLVSGPVAEVEAWVNAHWETYVVTSYAWSVIEGKQHVTAMALLKEEAEKAMRQMQLAQGVMQGGNRSRMQ